MTDSFATSVLTAAFNRYLSLDPEAPEKLKNFDGKLICIEIRGLNKNLYLSIDDNQLTVVKDIADEPDTTISGSPSALFKLGLHRDSAPLFFSGEVEIRGDTRLGRRFKSLLADMEIDREEYLSRVVGDIAAHRIAGVFHELGKWNRSAADNLADDVGEYLQEESRDIVSGAELDMFNQQVDILRDDVDRLEARIAQLDDVNRQS
jgi:ubiquinone biosynthesis protein UbiJ